VKIWFQNRRARERRDKEGKIKLTVSNGDRTSSDQSLTVTAGNELPLPTSIATPSGGEGNHQTGAPAGNFNDPMQLSTASPNTSNNLNFAGRYQLHQIPTSFGVTGQFHLGLQNKIHLSHQFSTPPSGILIVPPNAGGLKVVDTARGNEIDCQNSLILKDRERLAERRRASVSPELDLET